MNMKNRFDSDIDIWYPIAQQVAHWMWWKKCTNARLKYDVDDFVSMIYEGLVKRIKRLDAKYYDNFMRLIRWNCRCALIDQLRLISGDNRVKKKFYEIPFSNNSPVLYDSEKEEKTVDDCIYEIWLKAFIKLSLENIAARQKDNVLDWLSGAFMKEIGERQGVTDVAISQRIKKIREKLRTYYESHNITLYDLLGTM